MFELNSKLKVAQAGFIPSRLQVWVSLGKCRRLTAGFFGSMYCIGISGSIVTGTAWPNALLSWEKQKLADVSVSYKH